MAILGVHITKINAEKKAGVSAGRVGVNNNIAIKGVEERDFSLGQAKQKGLRLMFGFNCAYSPDLGSINLEGDVLFIGDVEKVKQIKKEWDDKKKLADELMEPVMNAALTKCNIEALKISQDINLPSPIPMPKVERKARPPAKAK